MGRNQLGYSLPTLRGMSRHLLTHVPRQPLRCCGAPPDGRHPRTNRFGGGAHHITTLRPVTAPAYARAAPGLRSPLLRRCRKRSGLSASASLRQATRIECRLFGRSTAEMFLLASGTRRRLHSRHSRTLHALRNTSMRNAVFNGRLTGLRSYLSPPRVPSIQHGHHHSATLSRYAVVTAHAYARAAPTAPLRPSVFP